MHRWWRRVALGLASVLVLPCALARCRAATQMFVEVSTDVPCARYGGTAIVVGRLNALDARPATSVASTCKPDGTVGTLVIVPSGPDDDEIAFQVTTGIGVDPATCTGATGSASCIVARRALRFLPHDSLRVRVPMKTVCAGVTCDPTSTCFNGGCVPATVDPARCTGTGCGEEVLGQGSASADGGAGADAGPAGADGGPIGTVTDVAIGQDHACAVVGGKVYCWGSNENGQIGIGQDAVPDTSVLLPTAVAGLPSIKAVSGGNNTTGVLTTDGQVYLWGANFSETIPGSTSPNVTTPFAPTGIPPLEQLCVGNGHGCGLADGGRTLWCWGAVFEPAGIAPTSLALATPAAGIGCGNLITVVRMQDGTVQTFGQVAEGLGRPGATPGTMPVAVSGVDGAATASTGWYDTFVKRQNGDVFVWGLNQASSLGDSVSHPSPTPAPLFAPYASFVVGIRFACGLEGGKVWCWGTNEFGQLGTPAPGGDSIAPVVIDKLPGIVTNLWGGGSHACARLESGELYCWGANDLAQLGGGSASTAAGGAHPDPVRVLLP